jgi:hypothetical protein
LPSSSLDRRTICGWRGAGCIALTHLQASVVRIPMMSAGHSD